MIAFTDRVIKEKELNSSERSRVLLVREKDTGARFIYREFAGSGDVYRRMLDVDCPWLPRIEAVEEKDGVTAVLEEYIQGDGLAFLLKGGPLPESQALSIAVQLCRALETLHGLDVVHRDVKPENVILRGGDAVLIDFDVSRLRKVESTTDTRVMGTTGYAAPEQYGFSQTDARADIYSLGVMLNEMLTGKHPSTKLAPGWIGRVVETCVEVNVDKRYPSAAALRAALEAGDPTPRKKRRRGLWIAAAAAVVALAVVLLLRLTGGEDDGRHEPLAVSGDVTDDRDIARMEFRYDLDGDGQEETYLFGILLDLPGRRPGGIDSRMLTDDLVEPVIAAPGVWRPLEDGSYEVAYEFAPLLEEPRVELWCSARWGDKDPLLWASDPLDDVWEGAIAVNYTAENAGIWRYVGSATLDGQLLTAAASTSIERTNTLAF